MSEGRILGLDPGERRIGVAISDPLGIIAQPHTVIDRRRDDVERELRNLCAQYEVTEIVVGLPVSLGGIEGPAADSARSFGDWVTEVTGCPVTYRDERFTSVSAEHVLLEGGARREQRRLVRDKVAAAIMLQSHLDARRQTG